MVTSAATPTDGAGRQTGAVPGEPGLVHVDIDAPTRALARREAVVEAGDDTAVGAFVDAYADGDGVVTARFVAMVDGYRGWRWSVTLAVVDRHRPTVSEVVLLPGPDALLAPEWVPWSRRVRAGDLGAGDLLPPTPDDVRIVPAYLQSDDPAVEDVAHELGIGRVRVLSREGRDEAATRWHGGDFGPTSDVARHAPAACATCAFFVPLAGSLGRRFGVCTNEFSPADGHVVDVDFGCGAHSESVVDRAAASASADTVLDELRLDVFRHAAADDAATGTDDAEAVDVEADDAEADDAVRARSADAGAAIAGEDARPAAGAAAAENATDRTDGARTDRHGVSADTATDAVAADSADTAVDHGEQP